jgi:hypothetical protein
MNIEQQIRTQLAYRPFRVFRLETTGGFQFEVGGPECFFEFPRGGFVVFVNDACVISSFSEIVSVTVLPKQQEAA